MHSSPSHEAVKAPSESVGCSVFLVVSVLLSLGLCVAGPLVNLGESLVGVEIAVLRSQPVKTLQWGTTEQETLLPQKGHEFLWVKATLHNTDAVHRSVHRDQFVMEGNEETFAPLNYWPLGSARDRAGVARVMPATLDRQLGADETFIVELIFEVPHGMEGKSVRFRSLDEDRFRRGIDTKVTSVTRVDVLWLEREGEDRLMIREAADDNKLLRLWVQLHNTARTGRALQLSDFQLVGNDFSLPPLAVVPRQPEDLVVESLRVADGTPDAYLAPGEEKELQLFFQIPTAAKNTALHVIGEERSGALGDWVYRLLGFEDERILELSQLGAVD